MNLDKYRRIASSLAAGGLLLSGLFLLLNGAPHAAHADPGNLFVTPGGSGDCSQGNPCDLQTALITASDGDTVYLAQGIYTGTGTAVVSLTRSITLRGGWDGSATAPPVLDPGNYPASIDGGGARRGVYVVGPVTVTLEGLTVANGKIVSTTTSGWNGAGLYARNVVLTLRHTRFYSNEVDVYDVADSNAYGGGVMVEGGSLLVDASVFRWNGAWAKRLSYGGGLAISRTLTATVTGTLFQDNDAWLAGGISYLGNHGAVLPSFLLRDSTFVDNGQGRSVGNASGGYAGALEVVNARAHIEGNVFRGNLAVNDYGALGIFRSDLSLTRNVITGNQCARTSGLYLYDVSSFTVSNNIIAGNQSTYTWLQSPAVRVCSGNGQFLHNTIARNQSDYGLWTVQGATVALTNTVLVSHTVGISVSAGSTARLEGTLWGNGTDWGGEGTIATGTVNIWGDPAFVDPDAGDYHIGPGSAGRNAGVNAGVIDDIDGDTRPHENGYDIGADEYVILADFSTSTKRVDRAATRAGQTLTYTLALTNTGAGDALFTLTDTLPAGLDWLDQYSVPSGWSLVWNGAARQFVVSGQLAADAAADVTFHAALDAALPAGTVVANTAQVNDGWSVTALGPATVSVLPPCHTLTATVDPPAGGSVMADPPPNCVDEPGKYAQGTPVVLTALTAADYAFDHWSGDAAGEEAEVTIEISTNQSVTAHFELAVLPCHTLTTTVDPAGSGRVEASAPNCNVTQYLSGTRVTLRVVANPGFVFERWEGDASGTANPTVLTMSADRQAGARFLRTVFLPLVVRNAP